MAYTKVVFENPKTGHLKEAPIGFSWTVFFFGFMPPLFRGDWKWGIIMFILTIITVGFSQLVFMFIYNKLYVKGLIETGFKAKSVEIGNIDQISQKIGIKIPMIETV